MVMIKRWNALHTGIFYVDSTLELLWCMVGWCTWLYINADGH